MVVVGWLLRKLRSVYLLVDRSIRHGLGDRTLAPYRPAETGDRRELLRQLYDDFSKEQPGRIRTLLLSGYLRLKHGIALPIKVLGRMVRLR